MIVIGRRAMLTGLWATGFGGALFAAGPRSPPTIGYLALASRQADARDVDAFRQGMAALGHVEGRSYVLIEVFADGDVGRAGAMLQALSKAKVDVVLAPGPASARTALAALPGIPIVALGLHPKGGQTDLFASLARPGGRVTGLSNLGEELAGKRVELLRELMPSLRKIAILHNASDPSFAQWGVESEAAARAQGLEAVRLGLASASAGEVARLFAEAHQQGATAVLIVRDFMTATVLAPITDQARVHSLAIMAEERRFPDRGALASYGPSHWDLFRRAAGYVDRLLKGEQAAELPIQQPTKFELIVNLKTARTLGLTIPPSILIRADEVIE